MSVHDLKKELPTLQKIIKDALSKNQQRLFFYDSKIDESEELYLKALDILRDGRDFNKDDLHREVIEFVETENLQRLDEAQTVFDELSKNENFWKAVREEQKRLNAA